MQKVKIDYTEKERSAIGDFLYSYKRDILIKNDCIVVVDIFKKYELLTDEGHAKYIDEINKQKNDVASCLYWFVLKTMPSEQITEIMKEYLFDNFLDKI
jgi:MoxR-like ATPase